MIYILYIIIVFKHIKKLGHCIDLTFFCKFSHCLRNHTDFGRRNSILFRKCVTNSTHIRRSSHDFRNAVLYFNIICTGFKSVHSDFIFVHIFIFDNDNTLFVKHKAYAACLSHITAVLIECVTYVCGSSVSVICKCVYDYRNTCRSITFVCDTFVVITVCIACRLFNCSVYIIVRHII